MKKFLISIIFAAAFTNTTSAVQHITGTFTVSGPQCVYYLSQDGVWTWTRGTSANPRATDAGALRVYNRMEMDSRQINHGHENNPGNWQVIGICGDDVSITDGAGNSLQGRAMIRGHMVGASGIGPNSFNSEAAIASIRTATDGSLVLYDVTGSMRVLSYNYRTGTLNVIPGNVSELPLLPPLNAGSGNSATGGNEVNALLETARESCSGISDKIDRIKTAAGISVATSAVGTVAAGAATVAGIAQMRAASREKQAEEPATVNRTAQVVAPAESANTEITEDADTAEEIVENIVEAAPATTETTQIVQTVNPTATADESNNRNVAGTVQTVGSFVAGGTSAAAAVSSFVGAGQFDEIIENMNNCTAAVREIDSMARQLAFEAPGDPRIAQYGDIAADCRGMDVSNIESVRNAMRAAGIVSSVGAVAGVAGGVMNVAANRNNDDESSRPSAAPTVLAGVATATSLTSTILSGTVLAGLNRNSEIAKACAQAFGRGQTTLTIGR